MYITSFKKPMKDKFRNQTDPVFTMNTLVEVALGADLYSSI